MTTCLLFATQIESFMSSIKVDEDNTMKASIVSTGGGYGHSASHTDTTKAGGLRSKPSSTNKATIRRQRIEVQGEHIRESVTHEAYIRMIKKFQDNFDSMLQMFLKLLLDRSHAQFHSHLSNLCTRIDYNGFYT